MVIVIRAGFGTCHFRSWKGIFLTTIRDGFVLKECLARSLRPMSKVLLSGYRRQELGEQLRVWIEEKLKSSCIGEVSIVPPEPEDEEGRKLRKKNQWQCRIHTAPMSTESIANGCAKGWHRFTDEGLKRWLVDSDLDVLVARRTNAGLATLLFELDFAGSIVWVEGGALSARVVREMQEMSPNPLVDVWLSTSLDRDEPLLLQRLESEERAPDRRAKVNAATVDSFRGLEPLVKVASAETRVRQSAPGELSTASHPVAKSVARAETSKNRRSMTPSAGTHAVESSESNLSPLGPPPELPWLTKISIHDQSPGWELDT